MQVCFLFLLLKTKTANNYGFPTFLKTEWNEIVCVKNMKQIGNALQ